MIFLLNTEKTLAIIQSAESFRIAPLARLIHKHALEASEELRINRPL